MPGAIADATQVPFCDHRRPVPAAKKVPLSSWRSETAVSETSVIPLTLCLLLAGSVFPTRLPAAPPVTALAIVPTPQPMDSVQLIVGSQAGLRILAWPAQSEVRTLPTELENIHDVRFSPDGRRLLVAGGRPGESGGVEIFRWPEGDRQLQRTLHSDVIYRVAWRDDGGGWITASGDGTCCVCSLARPEPEITYTGHSRAVMALCLLPAADLVVSTGLDQTLQVWRATTGQHVRTLANHVAAVHDVALRPANPTEPEALPVVASASDDRTLRLWQPTLGRLVRFRKLPAAPRALAWTRDSQQLWAGCQDGRIRAFQVTDLEPCADEPGLDGWIHSLVLTGADERPVAGGTGGLTR